MFGHDDPRYRGFNPLEGNPYLDGVEQRYVEDRFQGGTASFFVMVAMIGALALGISVLASGSDENVGQAGNANPSALAERTADATGS